jgi:V8-like Glu-specific endopeptidase
MRGARILLVIFLLVGCQTGRQHEPVSRLSLPTESIAGEFPAIVNMEYRPVGLVPFSFEAKPNGKNYTVTLNGEIYSRNTDRNTIAYTITAQDIVFRLGGELRHYTADDVVLADYEIDSRGYHRRVYSIDTSVFRLSGPTDTLDAALDILRSIAVNDGITSFGSGMGLGVYPTKLTIGDNLWINHAEDIILSYIVSDIAKHHFVDDEELDHILTQARPKVIERLQKYKNGFDLIFEGLVYVDGFEFIRIKEHMPQHSRTGEGVDRTGQILIDPYSGQVLSSDTVLITSEEPVFNWTIRRVTQLTSRLRQSEASSIAGSQSIAPTAMGDVGSLSRVYQSSVPSIVQIISEGNQGSGFFITENKIITNLHVVKNNIKPTIMLNTGQSIEGDVIFKGSDGLDLAIVKIGQPVTGLGLSLARSAPAPGTPITVIGSPAGLDATMTAGIVSAWRSESGVAFVQVDAAMTPGVSGGPVLNRAGEVVGIATFGLDGAQGLNFAISVEEIRKIIKY